LPHNNLAAGGDGQLNLPKGVAVAGTGESTVENNR